MLKEVLQEESPKKPKALMMSFKVLQKTKNTNDFSICASAAMRRPGTTQVPPHGCPNIAREASKMDDCLRGSQKGPKRAAQYGPRGYQDAQDGLQDGPEAPQEGQIRFREAPKTASDGVRRAKP